MKAENLSGMLRHDFRETKNHKNKDIDLEKEFAKLKIGVISCASFESVDKNSVRFRLPSPKYLSRIIEAFNIIDNLK